VVSGEILVELGNSWFSTKLILVRQSPVTTHSSVGGYWGLVRLRRQGH